MRSFILSVLFLFIVSFAAAAEQYPAVILQVGDKPVAEYRHEGVPFKPYISVLRTPTGLNILRDAPHDHLHHHGLMFALAVNGCNFWEEHGKPGTEKTVSFTAEKSSLKTELDWNIPSGETVLKEARSVSVARNAEVVLLDWTSVLKAPAAVPACLDKSNHHYFGLGMRFDQSMDKGGRFFNNTGGEHKGDAVRGDERLTPCNWAAYTAKLNGQPVTATVFGYSSNPIPTLVFSMGDAGKSFAYLGISLNLHRQPVDVEPEKPLTFRFRVAVWDGETAPEVIEKEYQRFVK
ncbi:MAG: PmoA family protein [Planctomycetaceae bacterium]|nr:PmoA family protein [Planctomycetaceae bacterium]